MRRPSAPSPSMNLFPKQLPASAACNKKLDIWRLRRTDRQPVALAHGRNSDVTYAGRRYPGGHFIRRKRLSSDVSHRHAVER